MKKVPDALHESHRTRISDASTFDEICCLCDAHDITGGGWGGLKYECKASQAVRDEYDAKHK